jgi:hypothetical protein
MKGISGMSHGPAEQHRAGIVIIPRVSPQAVSCGILQFGWGRCFRPATRIMH